MHKTSNFIHLSYTPKMCRIFSRFLNTRNKYVLSRFKALNWNFEKSMKNSRNVPTKNSQILARSKMARDRNERMIETRGAR